jgi:uncharacterized protein involved in exopolysaccharide biosynthesis
VYESFSRIQINTSNALKMGTLLGQGGNEDNSSDLATEILVLQSDTVILQTAQSLNLLDRLRGVNRGEGKAGAGVASGAMTPEERLALIGSIKGGLRVNPVGSTAMVDIRYRNQVDILVERFAADDPSDTRPACLRRDIAHGYLFGRSGDEHLYCLGSPRGADPPCAAGNGETQKE